MIVHPCSFGPFTPSCKHRCPWPISICPQWSYESPQFPGSGMPRLCPKELPPFFQLSLKCLHVLEVFADSEKRSSLPVCGPVSLPCKHQLWCLSLFVSMSSFYLWTGFHFHRSIRQGWNTMSLQASCQAVSSFPSHPGTLNYLSTFYSLVLNLMGSGTQVSIPKTCSPFQRFAHDNQLHQVLKEEEEGKGIV